MIPFLVFLGLVALVIGFSVLQNRMHPPRELAWDEVPDTIRRAVDSALPGFEADSARYLPVPKTYRIPGRYRSRRGLVEIEVDPAGAIREIEFEDPGCARVLEGRRPAALSEVPPGVTDALHELLGDEADSFRPSAAVAGRVGGEPAFEIRGRSDRWTWEMELTGTGRLVELEKTVRAGTG